MARELEAARQTKQDPSGTEKDEDTDTTHDPGNAKQDEKAE